MPVEPRSSLLHVPAKEVLRGWPIFSSNFAFPALLAVTVLCCLARCYAGLFGVMVYPHDAFALLDPAWRILNHQKPHLDFYSQLGPFPYLQTALGLMLAGNGIEGLVYGQAIVGFAIAIWSYALAVTKFAPLHFLLSIYVLFLVIAPFNVGENFAHISAGMTYNRMAYGLMAVILIEALGVNSDRTARNELPGGLSTGSALALLLFTKVTFFLGAAALVVMLTVMRRQPAGRWIGIASGFCAVSIAFSFYLQFQFSAILIDYRISAGAKHIGPTKLLGAGLAVLSDEGISFAAFVSLVCFAVRRNWSATVLRGWAIAGVGILLVGAFLLFGNFQERGLPLNMIPVLFLAGIVFRSPSEPGHRHVRSGLMIWAVVMTLGLIAKDASSLSYAVFGRLAGDIPKMRSPGLAMFRIRDESYASFVDEGLALAAQHLQPADTVVSLDFSDFYSYALRIKPPLGGASCLHFGSTFSDRSHPAPEKLLGSASIAMVPIRFSENGSQLSIPRIYGPYLAAHFRLEATSQEWHLYRRSVD